MKTLVIVSALLSLIGCAHERTEMDRELALRLVDKAGRIEIVQSGGQPLLGPVAAQQAPSAYMQQPGEPPNGESQTCVSTPQYSLHGKYLFTSTKCW